MGNLFKNIITIFFALILGAFIILLITQNYWAKLEPNENMQLIKKGNIACQLHDGLKYYNKFENFVCNNGTIINTTN